MPHKIARVAGHRFPPSKHHSRCLAEILQRCRDKGPQTLTLPGDAETRAPAKSFITGKQRSYFATKREIAPSIEYRSHKGRNNRVENSHPPFRKQERGMQEYRSPENPQLFKSFHSANRNFFSVPAHRCSALTIRYHCLEAFGVWNSSVCSASGMALEHVQGSRGNVTIPITFLGK